MKTILSILIFFSVVVFANTPKDSDINAKVDSLQKPLYNPFVENYILNELKQLREENRDLKIELYNTLAKKEIEISNNAINYATSTINNMFYIIAAASSIFVIIGWGSLRDINEKITNIVNDRVAKVVDDYEKRMHSIEKDLEDRSKQVRMNQQAIEETNTIHSLWMRASQESTPSGKIEIYDEILELRPNDVEALTYKSDAILDMGEANWALNLTNQAIDIDDNYPNAYYQRAKVYSVLGHLDNALSDLEKAIDTNDQYIKEIKNEEEFDILVNNNMLDDLLSKYTKDAV